MNDQYLLIKNYGISCEEDLGFVRDSAINLEIFKKTYIKMEASILLLVAFLALKSRQAF